MNARSRYRRPGDRSKELGLAESLKGLGEKWKDPRLHPSLGYNKKLDPHRAAGTHRRCENWMKAVRWAPRLMPGEVTDGSFLRRGGEDRPRETVLPWKGEN